MLHLRFFRPRVSLLARQLSGESAASRSSFLTPSDFLDGNLAAKNAVSNASQTEYSPSSIKLGVQLTKYGVNMTKLAQEGKLETVIGRDTEIQQAIQILSRRRKNNPCLIGEAGVGKTSIVEGLAQLIARGHVPESMRDKVIISLDLASMLAGTKFRGEFEERLKGVMKEIELCGDRIILFIDEIHTLVGAGGSEGAIDASNILKPSLARGYMRCLGTTTVDEYSRYIEKDAALARRFQAVFVNEPTEDQTFRILQGLRSKYELHHKVVLPEDTIRSAVKLSGRYYTSKHFPDKAIDLIDEASSRLRNKNESLPNRVNEIDREIEALQEKINGDLLKEDISQTALEISLKDELALYQLQEERNKIMKLWKEQNNVINLIFETKNVNDKLKAELKNKKKSSTLPDEERNELLKLIESIKVNEKTIRDLYQSIYSSSLTSTTSSSPSAVPSVTFRNVLEEKDVAEVVAMDTGIPLDSMLVKENSNALVNMEEEIKTQIVGQDDAIETISKCIRLSKAGLRFHDRPIGVFLFVGPTGVGKTELAKAVNGILFKDQPSSSNILRIDMSEYMERFSVSRLIGAPPGYVGYDEGGVLTDAIRRRPYQLVLLDEFEKAHREVSNLLLQVFDEGRLTDSHGRIVDFRNTVIIMTSNLGSDVLAKYDESVKVKKSEAEAQYHQLTPEENEKKQEEIKKMKENKREIATKLVHQHFSPEFVNRLDDVIVFNSLTVEGIMKICSIQLKKVKQLLKDKGIILHYSEKAAEQISLSGSNLQYGARPLKRLIQNEILSPLASRILSGEIKTDDEIFISVEDQGKEFMNSIISSQAETTTDSNQAYHYSNFSLELSKDAAQTNDASPSPATETSTEGLSPVVVDAIHHLQQLQEKAKEKKRLQVVIRRAVKA